MVDSYLSLGTFGVADDTEPDVKWTMVSHRLGRRVLLIDADPQGSSLVWSTGQESPDFSVVGMPTATIHKEIALLARDYDDVVVDGPPRIAELAR